MEEKEPGFWVRWAAGIVAAVVGGVLVAVLAGAFKDGPDDPPPTPTPTPTPSARVRITQFSMPSGAVGTYPKATFNVYNAGDDTADRCQLEWHPFDSDLEGLAAVTEYSEEFALEAKTSHAFTLPSDTPYSAGLVTSGAKVECSNAESQVVTERALGVPEPE